MDIRAESDGSRVPSDGDADARGERATTSDTSAMTASRSVVRRSETKPTVSSSTDAPLEGERAAQVAAGLRGGERRRAGADHGRRDARQRRGAVRPRGPVERVLEGARDAEVVLRRRDQEGVGIDDRRPQPITAVAGIDLEILVVGGHVGEPVPDHELDVVRRVLLREAQEQAVVRFPAEEPEIARMRVVTTRGGSRPDVEHEPDLLGHGQRAVRQRRVPRDAELGAVDDGAVPERPRRSLPYGSPPVPEIEASISTGS